MGERKITKTFWLPDGNSVQVNIETVENQPTVVVIPIPAPTAEIANLLVTPTITRQILATPFLDTRENQRLVDLLAYMKRNLGTYTVVSLINLLHEICNLYDLEFRQKTKKVGESFKRPYEVLPIQNNQLICFTTKQNPDGCTLKANWDIQIILPMVQVRKI